MKKSEVQIGNFYVAKVSNTLVPLQIKSESPYGGWNAVNKSTGRDVRVRSASRLRYEVVFSQDVKKYVRLVSRPTISGRPARFSAEEARAENVAFKCTPVPAPPTPQELLTEACCKQIQGFTCTNAECGHHFAYRSLSAETNVNGTKPVDMVPAYCPDCGSELDSAEPFDIQEWLAFELMNPGERSKLLLAQLTPPSEVRDGKYRACPRCNRLNHENQNPCIQCGYNFFAGGNCKCCGCKMGACVHEDCTACGGIRMNLYNSIFLATKKAGQ